MTELIILCIASFVTSLLTFFSGFGLGTILMPVFAIFFPVELAIALTGVVHFLNNIFKLSLVGLKADKLVVIRFGIPAFIAAFVGAWVLLQMSDLNPLYEYSLGDRVFTITPLNPCLRRRPRRRGPGSRTGHGASLQRERRGPW